MVSKVPGPENPADLMTKILTRREIDDRLKGINISLRYRDEVNLIEIARVLGLEGEAKPVLEQSNFGAYRLPKGMRKPLDTKTIKGADFFADTEKVERLVRQVKWLRQATERGTCHEGTHTHMPCSLGPGGFHQKGSQKGSSTWNKLAGESPVFNKGRVSCFKTKGGKF